MFSLVFARFLVVRRSEMAAGTPDRGPMCNLRRDAEVKRRAVSARHGQC